MAQIGNTTAISVSDGVSSAYAGVPNAFAITVPAPEYETVEATNLDSGGVRQHIAGLVEPGSYGFSVRYDETALDRAFDWRGVVLSYRITFPDGSHLTTSGIATKVDVGEVTPDGVMEFKVEVKATNIGTLTTA